MLKMQNITKRYPGVLALDGVSLNIQSGTVHGLIGENGAGKSTLMKILAGTLKADSGEIYLNNERIAIDSVEKAQSLGIAFVHQELSLFNNITVAQNLFVMKEPCSLTGLIDDKKMIADSEKILSFHGISINPSSLVRHISIAQRQLLEIIKCIKDEPKILVLDEPTSSLSEKEAEILFSIMFRLRKAGCAIVYISHKMREIFRVCDEITVFRNGKYVASEAIENVDHSELVKLMTGRDILHTFPEKVRSSQAQKTLDVKNICGAPYYENISFHVHKGEIFGLYGLVGSGRTEIAKGIFGIFPNSSGQIFIDGKEMKIHSPRRAIEAGIAFVTENRREEGLVTSANIEENISMVQIEAILNHGFINGREEKLIAEKHIANLKIKTPDTKQIVSRLSGGNQQKVVLAKWFQQEPKIFIFDEPTRGIDVGAKFEVYQIIQELARKGVAIILISSELPEIMNLCHRVGLVRNSTIIHQARVDDISEEEIISKLIA